MEIEVRHRGNKRFEANARGHVIVTDQPFDIGGRDSGMTPPELFLAALGTCAAYYVHEYLEVRGLAHKDLKIRVSGVKALNPARISSIAIEVITDCLSQRHREGLERAVDQCLIHNTLLEPPVVDVRLVTPCDAVELAPLPIS